MSDMTAFRPFCALLLLIFAAPAYAEAPSCSATDASIKEKIKATAGTVQNLRNAEGSIRYESRRMLDLAVQGQSTLKNTGSCTGAACPKPSPVVVFTSVPSKLNDPQPECTRLSEQTKRSPIVYEGLSFKDVDELSSWFSDFSQGKGKEGKDLYARCPGDCSPRYTTLVKPIDGALHVKAEVVCGEPRDKWDNGYDLSYGYRWECDQTAN